jgi:tetratricopeptide (TPR) repeat protein
MKITSALVALAFLAGTVTASADKKVDDAVAKAEDQLQKGKVDEAQKTILKLAGTETPEAQLAVGRFQEKLGNFDEAAAAMAKAQALAGAAPPALQAAIKAGLAEQALARGPAKTALGFAQEAAKLEATPDNLAILARAQARTYDVTGAVQTADQAVQAGATNALAHEARGDALLAMGRGEDAATAYRKALELDLRLNRARIGLARALIAQGKATEAVAEARKASDADQKSGAAFAVLGAGIAAENSNHWNDAIAQAQQGAFLDPKNPLVQAVVGDLFAAAGNADQAANAYRRAAEVDPGNADSSAGLIQMLVRKGDLDGALAAAKKLATEVPGSGKAQLELGRILARKADWQAAVEPLDKATTLLPGVAEGFALLGTAQQFSGNTASAEDAYAQAVKLDPKNQDYQTTYGLLVAMVGRPDEGAAILQKVVATPAGQKSVAAWANLGYALSRMKPPKIQESQAAYNKALGIDPKNAQVHLGLGWANYWGDAYDPAIASFQKAMELEPKLKGEALNGIGWSQYFKKDMAAAKATATQAKTEGRNVDRLVTAIGNYEKKVAAGNKPEIIERKEVEGPDVNDLMRDAQSPNAAKRRTAASELRKFGKDAVATLIFMVGKDDSIAVRRAALKSLSAIGPAARDALPHLRNILNAPSFEKTNPTPQELQFMMDEGDFKRELRDAIPRIEGRG